MPAPDWFGTRRGKIACGDCLDVMRTMQPESVDLIYADPPFNSGRDYSDTGGQFGDTWESSADYLQFMNDRLVEMRRLLKPTGAIYLHCDDTEMHYLKVAMDGIFDRRNYRNTITWRRIFGHHDGTRQYGRNADYLLYYTKSNSYTFNQQRLPASNRGKGARSDKHGCYELEDLQEETTGMISAGGIALKPWREYDIAAEGRFWKVPKKGRYAQYIEENFIPGYRALLTPQDRLDALAEADLLEYRPGLKWPDLKYYTSGRPGAALQTIWAAMPYGVTHFSFQNRGELTYYPTQKPLHLLKPIIETSSNFGDLVFDPFCGSGTTLVAADQLQRKWLGCDISQDAVDIAADRLNQDGPFI